jgi:hypothetical protein
MSFVKELEEKMALERRKLLETVLDYLHSAGVDAHLSDETSTDVYGNIINEPVIRIKGRNIDNIRVTSSDFFGCGMPETISRFHYEVSLDKRLDSEMVKQLEAKIDYKRENKKLGIFGGEVTGVHWTGEELADLLNGDNDISGVLFGCCKSPGNPEFQVRLKTLNIVEIQGPRFADLWRIQEMFKRGVKEGFEECVFGFKTADRIAGHVKSVAGAHL